MSEQILKRLVEAAADAIDAHADELTQLDQKIGDGDHGLNMKRGFAAMRDEVDVIAAMPFGAALQKAGMVLVMKVGGASGPLYGSLLMAMGKACAESPETVDDIAVALEAGIEAVKARGKSDVGAKTMLDVLAPVLETLEGGGDLSTVRAKADAACAATRDMLATKGRASFLGERSIGHIDPGARSSALLINTVCDVLEAP